MPPILPSGLFEDNGHRPPPTLSSLFLLQADYGFLPEDHPAVQFVRSCVARLLPDVAPADLPPAQVLASTGFDINAAMFADGTMVVSPERIRFAVAVQDLDGTLLHELNHWAQQHVALRQQTARSRAILRSLGAQARVGEAPREHLLGPAVERGELLALPLGQLEQLPPNRLGARLERLTIQRESCRLCHH